MVPERKRDRNFMKDMGIHCESNVWSSAQRLKNSQDLMLHLNETIDQLVMTNSVYWYGHVLRMG